MFAYKVFKQSNYIFLFFASFLQIDIILFLKVGVPLDWIIYSIVNHNCLYNIKINYIKIQILLNWLQSFIHRQYLSFNIFQGIFTGRLNLAFNNFFVMLHKVIFQNLPMGKLISKNLLREVFLTQVRKFRLRVQKYIYIWPISIYF